MQGGLSQPGGGIVVDSEMGGQRTRLLTLFEGRIVGRGVVAVLAAARVASRQSRIGAIHLRNKVVKLCGPLSSAFLQLTISLHAAVSL